MGKTDPVPEKSSKSPPSPVDMSNDEAIPVLPLALGVGAIVAGALLMAIVLGSGSSKNVTKVMPTAPVSARPIVDAPKR